MRPVYALSAQDLHPAVEGGFYALVDFKVANAGGCWPWTGMKTKGGYGRFKILGVKYVAHRVSYALAFGHVPIDKVVMHECHNPSCVAPHHLTLGTDKQNIAARDVRKREALCPTSLRSSVGRSNCVALNPPAS